MVLTGEALELRGAAVDQTPELNGTSREASFQCGTTRCGFPPGTDEEGSLKATLTVLVQLSGAGRLIEAWSLLSPPDAIQEQIFLFHPTSFYI